MCTTTERTKTANPGTANPAGPKPAPLPPILTLQHFLDAAYTTERANLEPSSMVINGFTLKSKDAAISIVLIDSGDNHQSAAINGEAMDYSGSLVKVAALYAAHDLRAAARQHAKDHSFSDTPSFLSSLATAIDTTGAVDRLKAFGQLLTPTLTEIFIGFKPTAPNKVEFKPSFQTDLNMIGENANAGRVIRALGYSFINVSLMKEHFFDPVTLKGIWLAGDYSGEAVTKSVRVPVDNDTVAGGSGQAITTKEMSRMLRLVHTGKAFSHVADAAEKADANNGVHDILQTEGSFFENTTSTVHISVTPQFVKHCPKVGIGTLGPIATPGPSVISEGAVMVWNNTSEVNAFNSAKQRHLTRDFALVWQNLYKPDPHFDALVRIVNSTIKNFLTQP